jgi:hypothetical protein
MICASVNCSRSADGRRRYCSDRCSARARQRRYRKVSAGKDFTVGEAVEAVSAEGLGLLFRDPRFAQVKELVFSDARYAQMGCVPPREGVGYTGPRRGPFKPKYPIAIAARSCEP